MQGWVVAKLECGLAPEKVAAHQLPEERGRNAAVPGPLHFLGAWEIGPDALSMQDEQILVT